MSYALAVLASVLVTYFALSRGESEKSARITAVIGAVGLTILAMIAAYNNY